MSDKYIREIGLTPTNGRHIHILNEFVNASRAYIISRDSHEGYTFWLVTPDSTSRVGLVNGTMLSGRMIVSLLDSLVATGGNIELSIENAKLPSEPIFLESWRVVEEPKGDVSDCYRTYMSSGDLEKIFSFPNQKEYDPYKEVIIVTSTTSLHQGVSLPRITLPVDIVYTVVCPEGVRSTPDVVRKGERMTLVFSKPGFTSQSLTLSAGSPSPFLKYFGGAILVNLLSSVGLNFTRRIPVKVRTSNGRHLTGYEITVNGRPVDTSHPYIDLTERDLAPGNVVEILVTSTNFEALMVKLPAEQADINVPLDLVLTPDRQGICLRLNFQDGTTIEHEIFLERTDPRYRELRAGSYCGFRSHMISVPGEPEKYNIDVRTGGRPLAVSVTPQVPLFSSEELKPNDIQAGSPESNNEDIPRPKRKQRKKESYTPTWLICLGIVVAVALAAAAVLYLPGLYKEYVVAKDDVIPEIVAEFTDTIAVELSSNTPDNVPGVAETSAIQAREEGIEERREKAKAEAAAAALSGNADMGYLKDTRVWKRSELKTEDGRRVYDVLCSGNIDSVLMSPYFNSGNVAINPLASKIADFLYQCKGTPTQRSNEVVLIKLKDKESIDLWQLYETLGRYRPADKNPGSRP